MKLPCAFSFFCIILFCFQLLLLSACAPSNDITGTWKIIECIIDDTPLTDLNDCFFYFYEDGTGKKVILEEEQFTYSYSFDGNTCVLFNITYPDGEVEAGTYAEMRVQKNTMYVTANEDGHKEEIVLKREKDS